MITVELSTEQWRALVRLAETEIEGYSEMDAESEMGSDLSDALAALREHADRQEEK